MSGLEDLTVGSVSGMIAAAIFVVQTFMPLALPIILLGLLREHDSSITQPAASWSVTGRFLHSTLWPTILGSDSAGRRGVGAVVAGITYLSSLTLLLVGIAAVVTPLGLYESVMPTAPRLVEFHHIGDPSPMGYGTPPRGDVRFSRVCGAFAPVVCPGSNGNITTIRNSTSSFVTGSWYDTRIPQRLIDLYQSGVSPGSSVSSMFDIQWRSYTFSRISDDPDRLNMDNGTRYPVGAFRQIDSVVMNNKVEPVQGLIVDTTEGGGGVGFRDHTAPPVEPFGSTWTEDILFMVPETQCVDTNLTLDFSIPLRDSESVSLSSQISDLVITDRGGFANLALEYPAMTFNDTQNDPQLWQRAYKAAWLNNAFSMMFMNVSNVRNESDPNSRAFEYLDSHVGKTFPLHSNDSRPATLFIQPGSLLMESEYGGYLRGTDRGTNATNSTSSNSTIPGRTPLYLNPWNIANADFDSANLLCQGSGGGDFANITNIAARCGLFYGAPQRDSDGESLIFDPGSKWKVPMYSCITVTKAVIKTVTFRFNGTDDLSGLTITDIHDKEYPSEESKPLWGVENLGMLLSDVPPLWGLVSPESVEGVRNISTIRKESLYLPGLAGLGPSSIDTQNLPGVSIHATALGVAYEPVSDHGAANYDGRNQLAMYRRWQDLSGNVTTAGVIKNLIWTDVVANAVTGTRSIGGSAHVSNLAKRDDDDDDDGDNGIIPAGSQLTDGIPVVVFEKRIRYRYLYGIPAFIALTVTAAVFFMSLVLFALRRTGPSKLRKYLDETSVGRILTANNGINSRPTTAGPLITGHESAKVWAETSGRTPITLGKKSSIGAGSAFPLTTMGAEQLKG